MKSIRICLVLLLSFFASNGYSAEDFVFHCVEDERAPIWSSFTVIPILPANNSDTYVEKKRRYQLFYMPKDEQQPRLVELTEQLVDESERSFTVKGKFKISREKIQRLKSYLREGTDEAFMLDQNPDKVEVEFNLTFKIDNITGEIHDPNSDFGIFSYNLRLSEETSIPVSSNRAFKPNCIGGRKVTTEKG